MQIYFQQSTSSYYQKSYWDLGFWYCICQLNQYIYKYWGLNVVYAHFLAAQDTLMWYIQWKTQWNKIHPLWDFTLHQI